MAYIGNVPAEKYTALTQQTFSSPTGTSFTLDQACTNSVDIDLYIDNVKQNPASYSVSGTALTTSTISSPSTMYCIFNGRTTETVNPPDDSVGTAKVSDNAITLAKMAGGTDGQIITYDASGDPVAVGPGTDGQVLTSTGAGSPPAFEDAGGGAWAVVASGGAGSNVSALDYTSIGTKDIWMRVNGMTSTSSSDNVGIRISQSSSFVTSGTGYNAARIYREGSDALVTAKSQDQTHMLLTNSARLPATGGDSVRAFNVDIHIFDPGGTSRHTLIYSYVRASQDGVGVTDSMVGSFDANTSAIDGIRVYALAANFNYDNYVIMELN